MDFINAHIRHAEEERRLAEQAPEFAPAHRAMAAYHDAAARILRSTMPSEVRP